MFEIIAASARRLCGAAYAHVQLYDGELIHLAALESVNRFPRAQIDLLQTFADQAVIAIENVRLFKELQSRTVELTRSVDELRALGAVSRRGVSVERLVAAGSG